MMPMHISGDENVDTSINITSEGSRGLYQLVKFILKHVPKTEEKAVNKIVEESLSLYRGGAYDTTMGPQLEGFLENLTGLDDITNIPFEFQGNRTDLSYFWRKDENENRPTLSKEIIEKIPDDNIRRKVEQTMAKCYVDGFLDYNSTTHSYTITAKGIDSIYKSDFVSSRIERETTDILKAEEKLEAESRMAERGFSGCNRITIDVKSLGAVETQNGLFSRVPNTKGKLYVELPKDEFFYVNEKTVEAYINQGGSYTLLDKNSTPQKIVSGEELSKFYEIKNPAQVKAESTSLEEIHQENASETYVPQKKATFKAGEEVWATSQYEEGVSLSLYKVEYAIEDKVNGEIVYKLIPDTPDKAVILQTESCVGITVFKDQFYGTAMLTSEAGKITAIQMKEKLAASALGVPPSNGAVKQATTTAAQTTAKGIGTAASASTPVTAAVSAAAQVVETTIKGITR